MNIQKKQVTKIKKVFIVIGFIFNIFMNSNCQMAKFIIIIYNYTGKSSKFQPRRGARSGVKIW
ncbi:MAG: hypothetical protein KAT34_05010, partial [Candidatus Aminicenantes bacterium]|nr:hypothetical protein [Candidatus Aminicenantes bacterium]